MIIVRKAKIKRRINPEQLDDYLNRGWIQEFPYIQDEQTEIIDVEPKQKPMKKKSSRSVKGEV